MAAISMLVSAAASVLSKVSPHKLDVQTVLVFSSQAAAVSDQEKHQASLRLTGALEIQ